MKVKTHSDMAITLPLRPKILILSGIHPESSHGLPESFSRNSRNGEEREDRVDVGLRRPGGSVPSHWSADALLSDADETTLCQSSTNVMLVKSCY